MERAFRERIRKVRKTTEGQILREKEILPRIAPERGNSGESAPSLSSPSISSEISRSLGPDGAGYAGFLDYEYPLSKGSPNTRKDAAKNLRLIFGKLGEVVGKTYETVTLADLRQDTLSAAYLRILGGTYTLENVKRGTRQEKPYATKTKMKVAAILAQFLDWEIKAGRVAAKPDLMEKIREHSPNKSRYVKERRKKLTSERWPDLELRTFLDACKDGHALSQPLDYEIFVIMRYMGLPPADIYQLSPQDFRDGEHGLEFHKERAKESDCEYAQPIDKGHPMDSEILRIITERIRICKRLKQDRLFIQPNKITRERKSTSDQDAWVANLSKRRGEIQKALGLQVRPTKGLRSTFATYWVRQGIPLNTLAVWMGHSPGSSMIREFYSDNQAHSYWKLPTTTTQAA